VNLLSAQCLSSIGQIIKIS